MLPSAQEISKSINQPSKMALRMLLTTTSVLIISMRTVSVYSLKCHRTEYEYGTECCPRCQAGSRVKSHCTEFRSTSCLPCIEGTFMDKPHGQKQCYECSICDSGLGLKMKWPCSFASDTFCEPLDGFFCSKFTQRRSCTAAQRYGSCKPGQYISKTGTSSSDTECSDCSDGTFSDGSSSSCRPHRQCESENLHQIKAGTSSSDAECGEQSSSVTEIVIIVVVLLLIIVMVGLLYKFREKIKSIILGRERCAIDCRTDKSSGEEDKSIMIAEGEATRGNQTFSTTAAGEPGLNSMVLNIDACSLQTECVSESSSSPVRC